jgi:tol-pal system protein YbgF
VSALLRRQGYWGRVIGLAALSLALSWGAVGTAQAGLFDDEEARRRVEQLRTQLDATVAKSDTLARNQFEFSNQFEALRAEIARINGAVEVLKYELESAQKRQQDFYVDLDNRLRKLEPQGDAASSQPATAAGTAGTAGAAGTVAGATAGTNPAQTSSATPATPATPATSATPAVADTVVYEKAITALKAGKAKEAASGFDGFISSYPQSKLLGSAHYWNAYARSQLKDYKGAAALFGKFANTWPTDTRAPDALESQADNLVAAKDAKGARDALNTLAEKYPTSDAGKRARVALKKK